MKKATIIFLILGIFFLPIATVVAGNGNLTVTTDLDINKTLEELSEPYNYNIVFDLPTKALEVPEVVDIVFVMDTTAITNYSAVRNEINAFLDKIVLQNNLQVNVGVVKFSLDVTMPSSSLVSLNSGSLSTIKSYFSPAYTAGSNMYGGILAGRKLLETGSAPAENKYLIVASDFGGYKSDAGDGKGLSFFYRYSYASNGVTEAIHNNSDFHSRYYYTQTSNTETSVFTASAVDNLIKNKIFFTGVGVSAETDKYLTKTGSEAGEFPDNWRYSFFHTWTPAELALVIQNFSFTQRSDFPTAFEKNIYLSGNEFLDLKDAGYNVLAVTSPYQPEDGESYKRKFNAASNAFKDWFEINIGKRYEITENESFSDLLDDLESELIYLLGKGEIVDVVNSDFEVVPGNEMVSLNGTPLGVTSLGNGDTAFGTANNGIYPYIYHYEINSDGKEQITWTINKEANKNDLLHFVFQIKLKNKPTVKGVNTLDTNDSADVDYMSSKEVIDGVSSYTKTQSMPSPQIEITIGEVLVKYLDEEGNEIADSLSLRDIVGEEYSTFIKEIAGYEFVKVEGEPSGTYSETDQSVVYIYKKKQIVSVTEVLPKTGGGIVIIVASLFVGAGVALLSYRKKTN